MLVAKSMRIRVLPPNPNWETAYTVEAVRILSAFEGVEIELHHIGSTAIRGIFAKPIIDILLIVPDLGELDRRTPSIQSLGYEAMGEFGIPDRRYFRRNSELGIRTHQIHAFERGTANSERHLAFRDYMNAHPLAAQAYSALKLHLAQAFPHNIEAYMDGKDAFIKHHETIALSWQSSCRHGD